MVADGIRLEGEVVVVVSIEHPKQLLYPGLECTNADGEPIAVMEESCVWGPHETSGTKPQHEVEDQPETAVTFLFLQWRTTTEHVEL